MSREISNDLIAKHEMKKVLISSVISDVKACRHTTKRDVEIMGDRSVMNEDFRALRGSINFVNIETSRPKRFP